MYPTLLYLITPKTDWTAQAWRNYNDHFRIAVNFNILRKNIESIYEAGIAIIPNELNSANDIPFPYRLNQLEQNLYRCWQAIGYTPYELVTWQAYNAPTYDDFNRWERWQQEILEIMRINSNNILRCGIPGSGQSRIRQKRWRVLKPKEYYQPAYALHSGLICGADRIQQLGFRA